MTTERTMTAPDGREIVLGEVGQRVVFDNDTVRVWEISLEPGESQPFHRHDNPYLVVALEAADNRIEPLFGAEVREVHEPAGAVVYRESGEVHMLTNRGTTRYRSRLIELKPRSDDGESDHA